MNLLRRETAGKDWKKATTNNIDLILCDWNMPNMTGIDFVKALRGSGQKQHSIVMVTTEGGESKIEEAKIAEQMVI